MEPPRNGSKGRPSTPPPLTRANRLSQQYLTTPEQPGLNLPFSPGVKRNSNHPASPEFKLETPRNYVDDADEKLKKMKPPQYFSMAKKLQFSQEEESDNLTEILNKLKTKLSAALNRLPERKSEDKFTFTDISFDQSPTRSGTNRRSSWTPSKSIQTANLNLQTLQQSPGKQNLQTLYSPGKLLNLPTPFDKSVPPPKMNLKLPSSQSMPTNLSSHRQRVEIGSFSEDTSAHDALLAAISRQQMKKKGHRRTSSNGSEMSKNSERKLSERRTSVDLSRASVDKRASIDKRTADMGRRASVDLSRRASVDLSRANIDKRGSTDLSRTADLNSQASIDSNRAADINMRTSVEFSRAADPNKRASVDFKILPPNIQPSDYKGTVDYNKKISLPPLNVNYDNKTYEKDAVLSLMSLSSPQGRGHSRNQSYDNNTTTLPLIAGIIQQIEKEHDSDATDIDLDSEEN